LIRNLAYQLRRDILAVEAAVTEKWNNGPVEGQVNRLRRSSASGRVPNDTGLTRLRHNDGVDFDANLA
jgi:hypothetical protein